MSHVTDLEVEEERGVIQIVWYKGMKSGFSTEQATRCRVIIKGLDGTDHLFSESYGLDPDKGKGIARKWAGITGFEIKNYAERPVTTSQLYRVEDLEAARKRINTRV